MNCVPRKPQSLVFLLFEPWEFRMCFVGGCSEAVRISVNCCSKHMLLNLLKIVWLFLKGLVVKFLDHNFWNKEILLELYRWKTTWKYSGLHRCLEQLGKLIKLLTKSCPTRQMGTGYSTLTQQNILNCTVGEHSVASLHFISLSLYN